MNTFNNSQNVQAIETAPKAQAAAISQAAMLVEVSVSQWYGRKKDRQVSEEVTANKHAKRGVASVSKDILGGCNELKAINKFVANARNSHAGMTLPWSDTGLRLLPTTQYFKYHQSMTGLKNEFDSLVEKFLNVYEWEVSQAHASMGDLFNSEDYPSVNKLRGKFSFRINYMPLPEAGDFRVDVGNEQNEELASDYERYYQKQLGSAMNDLWERLYEKLSRMSERLDWPDGPNGPEKKIFHNTLVSNVTDMIELLELCNVTQDPKMNRMARILKQALEGVTAENLKINHTNRVRVKKDIDDAIKQLPSLDF